MGQIKKLQKLCHKIAAEHGFWDCTYCFPDSEIRSCTACNDTHKYRNNGELIALIHSELSEALEDLRKGNDKHVGEELADCVIRIMDFCEARKINLEKEILKKIQKNKKRPHKHNKKF